MKRQKFFWELQATRRASNKEAMIPSFRKRIPSLGAVLQAPAAIYRLRSAGPTSAITFRCSGLL